MHDCVPDQLLQGGDRVFFSPFFKVAADQIDSAMVVGTELVFEAGNCIRYRPINFQRVGYLIRQFSSCNTQELNVGARNEIARADAGNKQAENCCPIIVDRCNHLCGRQSLDQASIVLPQMLTVNRARKIFILEYPPV